MYNNSLTVPAVINNERQTTVYRLPLRTALAPAKLDQSRLQTAGTITNWVHTELGKKSSWTFHDRN